MLRHRFNVRSELNECMGEISEIAMNYPKDLDDCIFYIFTKRMPDATLPAENELLYNSMLNCTFIYGDRDWMDSDGAMRIASVAPQRFKIYTLKDAGHLFPTENADQLLEIIFMEMDVDN